MFLDFEKLDPKERYKLITASVVPRPIALALFALNVDRLSWICQTMSGTVKSL